MIRAFLAVELTPALRVSLAAIQRDLKQQIEPTVDRRVRISWVRPASMHLTLRFLGDMPSEMMEPLRMGIERVMSTQQALSLPLEGIGAFPHPTQPRVLWIGPSEGWQQGPEAGRLTALHRAIEDCCRARGFAADSRPFSPHLTLARIKEGGRQVGQALVSSGMMDKPGTTTGALPVEAISLMKSELEPTGSIYTKLWEVRINRI